MMSTFRKNIFLDFLSPENKMIYGTYNNISVIDHIRLLNESLNAAAFLAGEFCILPPFFPLQCGFTRNALSNKKDYLTSRLIILPLRESSLEDFFEKKVSEYSDVKSDYIDVFKYSGRRFIQRYSTSTVKRVNYVGNNIASKWYSGPDDSPLWEPIKKKLLTPDLELLRKIPEHLKSDGKSVTWSAMRNYLGDNIGISSFEINQTLQHEYANVYLAEFNATVITRIPPKTTDLLFAISDLSYDYICFKQALAALQVWDIFRNLSATSILQIRNTCGYFELISLFEDIAFEANDTALVRHSFAKLLKASKQRLDLRGLMRRQTNGTDIELSYKGVQAFDCFLLEITNAARSIDDIQRHSDHKIMFFLRRQKEMGKKIFIVHGTNHRIRDFIDNHLLRQGLSTVLMESGPMHGRTLPEKFEEIADTIDFAIVIATADDNITLNSKNVKRARQNVLIEIGYFWGKLGRKGKLAILLDNKMDIPSDLQGIGYIPITKDLGKTILLLEQELKAVNIL